MPTEQVKLQVYHTAISIYIIHIYITYDKPSHSLTYIGHCDDDGNKPAVVTMVSRTLAVSSTDYGGSDDNESSNNGNQDTRVGDRPLSADNDVLHRGLTALGKKRRLYVKTVISRTNHWRLV